MIDWNTWRFRASQMGSLMTGVKPNLTPNQEELLMDLFKKRDSGNLTNAQTKKMARLLDKMDKKPELSATAKRALDEVFAEQVFGRSKEIKSKYLDKGVWMEEHSLSLYSKVTGNILFKNEERFYNDFFQGTPDNCYEKIRDVKTSWDYSTFPWKAEEIPNKEYVYQLQTYMDLCDLGDAELIYCLVDTPHELIDDELRRLSWQTGAISVDSLPRELIVEAVQTLIYTEEGLVDFCDQTATDVRIEWFDNFKEIRPENRLKVFEIKRDDELIDSMRDQVAICREYLMELSHEIAMAI